MWRSSSSWRSPRAKPLLLLADLALLDVEVDEHADLGAQDLRLERFEDVVDRAHRVALKDVFLLLADRGEEDDRNVLERLARLDQLRRLEAVHARHLHVEQNDGEVPLEQATQRLLARRGADDALSQRLENRLEREKILRPVVHDEDIDLLGGARLHGDLVAGKASAGAPGNPASTSPISASISTRASGTARSAALGMAGLSAVSGRWTIGSPPRS
jgi:hypothetical protein